jgi:hypothetical protein
MLPLLWRGLSEAGQMSTVSFSGRTRFTNIPIVRRGAPPSPRDPVNEIPVGIPLCELKAVGMIV